MFTTTIIGTGSYIPEIVQSNSGFINHVFYSETNQPLVKDATELIEKFKQITGIEERRYADAHLNTSDIAAIAASKAIENSGIDAETLDQVIVAHNFGNVCAQTGQSEMVPSLASRVKHILGIRSPQCTAHDILFGCPGWLQALIHADAFGKAGLSRRCLLIGAETLSRVTDEYDRDSMIFSDGAGACITEYKESKENGSGILSSLTASYTVNECAYIDMGRSYKPGNEEGLKFMKMKGRKVYEFAITHVPAAMKACLEKAGASIKDLKKVFIHQANEKMDEAIIKRFYQQYDIETAPDHIMPMSIQWLGNSSVATIPTLYDRVSRGKVQDQRLEAGDVILFVSLGAGMNINAVCYRY